MNKADKTMEQTGQIYYNKIMKVINRIEAILITALIFRLSFQIWQHAADSGILPDIAIAIFIPYLLLVVPIIIGIGSDLYRGECHGYSAIGEQQYRKERRWTKTIMLLIAIFDCKHRFCQAM